MQKLVSECLALLLKNCLDRKPCPNEKLLKNVCSLLCADRTKVVEMDTCVEYDDISSMPPVTSLYTPEDIKQGALASRGANVVLETAVRLFGENLFTCLPKLDSLFHVSSLNVKDDPQAFGNALYVLNRVVSVCHPHCYGTIISELEAVVAACVCSHCGIRSVSC